MEGNDFDLSVGTLVDETIFYFAGPVVDETEHLMLVAVDRRLGDIDLDTYAREKMDGILSCLGEVETLRNGRFSLPKSETPVHELLVRWMTTEGDVLFKRYFFLVQGGAGLTFNCDFTERSFKPLSEEMTAMAAAFIGDGENEEADEPEMFSSQFR